MALFDDPAQVKALYLRVGQMYWMKEPFFQDQKEGPRPWLVVRAKGDVGTAVVWIVGGTGDRGSQPSLLVHPNEVVQPGGRGGLRKPTTFVFESRREMEAAHVASHEWIGSLPEARMPELEACALALEERRARRQGKRGRWSR